MTDRDKQEASRPRPPTYSENDRPLLASEIKQSLLDCGLIRKPPPSAHSVPPMGISASIDCFLNELPVELRQQIMLTYITSTPIKAETWRAPYYAGRDEEEALVIVPCKITWWLRGLRVLNLMAICKSWQPELIYIVEYLENQAKDEYDHSLDRANSGLKRLRGRTAAASEPTMRAYLREYRKSYVKSCAKLTPSDTCTAEPPIMLLNETQASASLPYSDCNGNADTLPSLQGSMLHTLWRLKQELSMWVYFREHLVSDGNADDIILWEYHLRDLREIACLQHKKKEEQDDLWQDLLVECRKAYLSSA
jgi:hypothetical protein